MQSMPQRVSEQRRDLVERILSDMDKKELRWTDELVRHARPLNPVTGTVYRGGNRLILSVTSMAMGYGDDRWVTVKQADQQGWGKLRKGAKSTAIEKWKERRFVVEDDDGEKTTRSYMSCVGWWNVFNASEFENAPRYEKAEPAFADAALEAVVAGLVSSSRCPVTERLADCASYAPAADAITMPLRGQYASLEAFARTLLHEMTHSTGHPSALDRNLTGRFGSRDYAFEELVAELGAVFSAAELGIGIETDKGSEHYGRHVAYLRSWMSALSEDPDALFRAAALASSASDFIVGLYGASRAGMAA